MMRFKLSKLARQLPLPLTIGLLASSLPAIAQENNNSSNKKEQAGLEVISVTAQKRVENVQEVPITISAVSADSIRDNDISNVTEISAFIPNVEMDATSPFAGSSSVLSAFIRGIGQNDFAFNLEPGVGLYVDGVYYARTIGAVVDTLNLERIEVLKGPQGTLFGRNTIGGAISITTRAPDEDFNFQTETTLGSSKRQSIQSIFIFIKTP
jgi:iron complex outermembrane recepter protein